MKITPKQYAQSLLETVEGKEDREVKAVIEKFIKVLIANNQVSQIGRIIDYFERMWNRDFGVVKVEIKSTNKLDKDVVALIKKYVIELSGAKEIKIEEAVDEKILGGFVVRYGDKIMDSSLRTRLQGLKEELKK